jgi:hypothetical protein
MQSMKKFIILLFVFCLCYGEGFLLYDPTKPIGYETKNDISMKNINFSMAFASEDNKVAIINGKSYHVGDFVGGNKIIEITVKKIVIQDPRTNNKIEISAKSSVKINKSTDS